MFLVIFLIGWSVVVVGKFVVMLMVLVIVCCNFWLFFFWMVCFYICVGIFMIEFRMLLLLLKLENVDYLLCMRGRVLIMVLKILLVI